MKRSDIVKAFSDHGINTNTVKNGQVVSQCLFCGKPEHFYLERNSGKWDCKSCGASGNVYTFLREVVEHYKPDTTETDYKALAKIRRLPPAAAETFRECGLVVDSLGWVIPTVNAEKGTVVNLHTYYENGSGKRELHATSAMNQQVYTPTYSHNGDFLHPLKDPIKSKWPVWIVEGHWDAIALRWLADKLKKEIVVLGVPGATHVLKPATLELLEKRQTVRVVYDNDSSGKQWQLRTAELIKNHVKPRDIATIFWPTGLPDGYDLNDYIADNHRDRKLWDRLESFFVPLSKQSVSRDKPKKAVSFNTLVKHYKKYFYLDRQMIDTWAVCLAVAISEKTKGEPLWIFVVGPPSSGKTVMLRSMETSERCVFQSVITPSSLVSGWRDEDGEDNSLIAQASGKTLIVNDYTTVLSLPSAVQEELNSILRDTYCGFFKRQYGNGVLKEYHDCQFSLIAGVTHAIHATASTMLGERFLKVEFLSKEHDSTTQLKQAIQTVQDKKLQEREVQAINDLRTLVTNFLDVGVPDKVPTVPKWVIERLIPMVQVLCHLRTEVPRNQKGKVVCMPKIEIGSRLGKQILHLIQCLTVVLGKKTVDQQVYEIAERVLWDTASGWQKEAFVHLVKSVNPLTVQDLCTLIPVGATTIRQTVDDMELIGITRKIKLNQGTIRKGRKELGYTITPKIQELWQKAKPAVL